MNPPTKFSKMRANRVKGERRAFDDAIRAHIAAESAAQVVAKIGAGEYRIDFPPEPPAAPAVPTMEIDGARYREERDNDSAHDACVGCAFDGDYQCHDVEPVAIKAFGGECAERRIIYLRVD